jgi:hypothetical protein
MANYLYRLCDPFNRFEEKSDLKNHIRSMHSDISDMVCHLDNCNEYFSTSDNFLEHLAIHCAMNWTDVSQTNISKLFQFYCFQLFSFNSSFIVFDLIDFDSTFSDSTLILGLIKSYLKSQLKYKWSKSRA